MYKFGHILVRVFAPVPNTLTPNAFHFLIFTNEILQIYVKMDFANTIFGRILIYAWRN